MLTLSEIRPFYPPSLHHQGRFMLREYLQHKILQTVFNSQFADKLVFLGGTCLRIVHGNQRFSEDLDFDNFQIAPEAFEEIAGVITKELTREGYSVEMKTVYKNAYHCHIRFPELLYQEGMSGFPEEKILIQLDTEPQHFAFTPERFVLNRFDVFTQIFTTPKDLLLAQKFYTVLNRARNKGRDFFDIVFLLSLIDKPNYEYLSFKAGITNALQLKERIIAHCATISMKEMAADVQPFLFNTSDTRKVELFTDYLEQFPLQ
ncbi:MAG: nucleotidyl transferase AbiEii/AbiGii toxin family protein [Chitinophagaceae bacterium]|nr:MAG: nucleotidyl transferase AbiEii/AbiGii toxin family protein [Chitinophagaceae bacterium]